MTATSIPPCWSNSEIQVAAQVDAGGLEFGDPSADAVFSAVHQTVPLARVAKGGAREPVTEAEVLADLCQPLVSNEPLIRFITGIAGRGKSHFVRWLRVNTPPRNDWHIVYIEKRNTSLRRIIEQVIDGIDAPSAASLRASLARAASRVTTVPEAMLGLLNHLHRLVEFDDAPVIQNLSGSDLDEMRGRVARLVGDYTFKQQLSRSGGPIERIAKLAKDGHEPGSDVNAEDLHLTEADLKVDAEEFLDAGEDFQRRVRELAMNRSYRAAAATILDYYLPRATADVFTGGSTDLLQVFEDVRAELARRNQQLVLFVEDLVLLHGIDKQIAQALTIPARHNLCRIRAVIAVTTGYLDDRYATFAERGVHYTMDVDLAAVDVGDRRSFVGRYLNAGRVGREELAAAASAGASTPNKCTDCVYRDRCHPVFGVTREGHGLFPFNAAAVDHLVALASPRSFDPRNILRTVIREPLAIAEAELSTPGRFPSARFGASLAPTRMSVPVELRDTIARQSNSAQAEISLRAFYATNPPVADDGLLPIAAIFGVALTELAADNDSDIQPIVEPAPKGPTPASEIDKWVAGRRLDRNTTQKIRRWILDALAARLQTGPHGLSVKRSASSILIGQVTIRPANVVIDNAAGGGSTPPDDLTIEFRSNDRDGVLLKGIVAAVSGDPVGPNGGRWFFEMQHRLARFEAEVVKAVKHDTKADVTAALAVLGVLSSVDGRRADSPASALATMIRPKRPAGLNPKILGFLSAVEPYRLKALTVVRDSLTQRKGTGAASIFDAGAVLASLLPSVRAAELGADLRDYASERLTLTGFHDKQAKAAQDLWAPVRDLVGKINGYVAQDEDLPATAKIMDDFVTQAHRASALTRQDAKESYDRLRPDGERLSILRTLTRAVQSPPTPSAVWELTSDPIPMLTEMLQYWHLCDRLLQSLRDPADGAGGAADTYNRARLQNALRDLANTLEGLAKG